jgi:hypothetical protein
MSVAYRRWELGGGAPGVGYNKKITGSPAQVHHHQYGSVDGTAVLRRQQQHQQQHQPHEPCNLSSFSIYMQQCPSAASAGTAVAATTTGKLQVMAATHSTLSLPDHQAAAAQEKAEEVERWGMMQMGHAGMGGCGHKLPVTSTRLSSSNVPRQFCSVQGGLSLMMNPLPKGEESAAPTTAEDCTTATATTPDALQRVHEVSHTAASRGVVGVFLPEEQCVRKKQELLPLAASSSPSSSSSSICDGREQSSCSSQEDTCGDVEAQSAYRGPLDQMSALESSLPIKYEPFFYSLSLSPSLFLSPQKHTLCQDCRAAIVFSIEFKTPPPPHMCHVSFVFHCHIHCSTQLTKKFSKSIMILSEAAKEKTTL